MDKVTLIDYGVGNLHSVERAFRHIGSSVEVSRDPYAVAKADRLVLPGVGAFGEGMNNLTAAGLADSVRSFIMTGKPFLGICLGMQLVMGEGEEMGIHAGLNLVPGRVVALVPAPGDSSMRRCKVPHIGWNRISGAAGTLSWKSGLLKGLSEGDFVYFAHSYVVVPEDAAVTLAVTEYGARVFPSVIRKGNIFGCQFHPEKSGRVGLNILKNFLRGD